MELETSQPGTYKANEQIGVTGALALSSKVKYAIELIPSITEMYSTTSCAQKIMSLL